MSVLPAEAGGEDFQQYAIVVSALADAITVVLLYALARRAIENEWVAALPGLLWALSPMSVTFAVGGMETSVNILWMVGAVWFYITSPPAIDSERKRQGRRHEVLVGVFAGLGLLTRIDAALWVGPLFLYQLVERWRMGARGNRPMLRRLYEV